MQALLAFKAQIRHDPNQVTSSWNESLHFCQWHGVTCSRLHQQRVTKLFLNSSALVGSISPHIGNLSFLRVLDLQNNSFTHQIPPQIGNLHRLQVLGLNNNSLSGTIPPNISKCFQLTSLYLTKNNLVGQIPSQLGSLAKLDLFNFRYNNLTGEIPPSLGNMSSLQHLQLLAMGFNNLGGSIPTDIGKVSRLEFVSFMNNKLSGNIPYSLGNLTMISSLFLGGNHLNGNIPSSLGRCHGLQMLDLSENSLDGKIPQQLLTGLLSLSIYFNLSSNNFTGSIPFEIGKLQVLGLERYSRSLSRNNFSGAIPQFLEKLNLERMNLSFNQLSGEVPTGGVFKNTSVVSLVGNAKLCGGMASLKLPPCTLNESKGGRLSRRMKLMISLVFGFTLLVLALVLSLFSLCKKRTETKSSTLGNSVLQVSYATLLKATDSFSPANLIGVGAFGSVYKGILADDRIVVAVKVLNMLHRGASKSFMAECEVLRNIRHRNLVKIITACSSIDFSGNDFKALVYEFMDNGSLEEWLHPSIGARDAIESAKSLSLVQRLNIAIDVACALNYLHNHCETPIVHCDLKPSNVLLNSNLTGHVSDFGLSKFLSVPTTSVGGNQSCSIGIRGSVGYAAPEYGMGSEVSANGDVYSFGILLLEMFTGKRPTDHMFSNGLNLHAYVRTILPERVSEISESLFPQERATNVTEAHRHSRLSVRAHKVEECLTLILGVGVACSFESPTNRKDISDAESELQSIRRNLLG
ncbi:probable LRR receptor-like serine/threonine-protein kinase At3g47570 [Argentina anserina]|uniref:probable LRR receptor-like serine/threonine-protein kinase At3g47570 n=1 Tax=Argentina anserina TaxID=57926 RepID=UPI00217660B6|nr:probable LRR receptor-like serine/threonine-protein kinase At3g47570 [Potentilla anserina]